MSPRCPYNGACGAIEYRIIPLTPGFSQAWPDDLYDNSAQDPLWASEGHRVHPRIRQIVPAVERVDPFVNVGQQAIWLNGSSCYIRTNSARVGPLNWAVVSHLLFLGFVCFPGSRRRPNRSMLGWRRRRRPSIEPLLPERLDPLGNYLFLSARIDQMSRVLCGGHHKTR